MKSLVDLRPYRDLQWPSVSPGSRAGRQDEPVVNGDDASTHGSFPLHHGSANLTELDRTADALDLNALK